MAFHIDTAKIHIFLKRVVFARVFSAMGKKANSVEQGDLETTLAAFV